MNRWRGHRLVSGCAVAFLVAVHLAAAALPANAASCSLDVNHDLTVTAGFGSVTVSRNATDILINGSPCAQLNNVRNVFISGFQDPEGGLHFNLQNGSLGPGFGTDGTTPEIEFEVWVDPGMFVSVGGGSSANSITAGTRFLQMTFELVTRINMNAEAEGSAPDEDVTIHTAGFLGLAGGQGNDHLSGQGTGTFGSRPVPGTIFFDDGPGSDSVVGGAGNDAVIAEDGFPGSPDTYSGGAGLDIISFSEQVQPMSVSLDDQPNDGVSCPGVSCEGDNVASDFESLETGLNDDVLIGTAGANRLDGNSGNNSVSGAGGPDTIEVFRSGADVVAGGSGQDTATYIAHTQGIEVTLDGLPNDGIGSEGDNIMGDVEVVVGTNGADQLTGSASANHLVGTGGNDLLNGLGGNDLLDGGGFNPNEGYASPQDGSDVLRGGAGVDTAIKAAQDGGLVFSLDDLQNDVVSGAPTQGVDNIRADIENVIGGPDEDIIVGSAASNRLEGGAGEDTLRGLGGTDVLVPGPGADSLEGGRGKDAGAYQGSEFAIVASLKAGTATGDGDDILKGLERLFGSANDDRLIGSGAANRISGGAGDDVLSGLAGRDRLRGGAGNDTLKGGPGTDTCKQGPGTGPSSGCEN